MEIVGIVGDTNLYAIREEPRPVFVALAAQALGPLGALAARVDGDAAAFAEMLRRAIHAAEPRLPVREVAPYRAQLEDAVRDERLLTRLTAAFAGLALLLAAIGLYGLTSYTVSRRTNEIGLRMALGADRSKLLGLVLRESVWLIGVGALAGMAAAWPGSRALQDVLFEVSPLEPAAVAAALALLAAAGLAAAYLPARRAAALNPVDALREE